MKLVVNIGDIWQWINEAKFKREVMIIAKEDYGCWLALNLASDDGIFERRLLCLLDESVIIHPQKAGKWTKIA